MPRASIENWGISGGISYFGWYGGLWPSTESPLQKWWAETEPKSAKCLTGLV